MCKDNILFAHFKKKCAKNDDKNDEISYFIQTDSKTCPKSHQIYPILHQAISNQTVLLMLLPLFLRDEY